ncbi:hypothetical protein H9P43_003226 [Blastocladiella emersonii ATCC 22665]|nr:hypothetical protein H9P43_003226 [Blastocladiella emersonii ATCC 22665]
MGSYMTRQSLEFTMETPAFLRDLKGQLGVRDEARRPRRNDRSGRNPDLDDDGPTIVFEDGSGGVEELDDADLARIRLMHPNAVIPDRDAAGAAGAAGAGDARPAETEEDKAAPPARAGPARDPKTGKLLFRAKAASPSADAPKATAMAAKKKPKAANRNLLSFDD